MRNSDYRRERGFGYVWMLLFVALLGVGLAIAGESWSLGARRDRERELLFIGAQFRDSLRSYYVAQMRAGKHEYPSSLDELLQDSRFPGVRRHLRKVYVDPMTGKAEWGLVTLAGGIVGVHSLSDAKPLKQANFEPADADFEGRSKYSEWVFSYSPAQLEQEDANLQPQPPPAVTMPGSPP